MAPGTPGPSGAKAPLEPFPVPQRTLDLRREDVYLRITLSSCETSGDRLDVNAPRALETALRRALAKAHGVVGGAALFTEVLEASVVSDSGVVSGSEGDGIIHRLSGVVKAPLYAESKITSALALCQHPERGSVVARANDLVALGMDARSATRRAVRGETGERGMS